MGKFIELIKANVLEFDIQYRVHATKRMFQRDITETDVIGILFNGDIIERYEDDFPFPSVLLNGRSLNGRPLHAVVGVDIIEKRVYIITVYEPEVQKWTDNFSRRL